VQSVRSGLSTEAVELLGVYADDVVQIAVPAQNGSEHVVELGSWYGWNEKSR